MNLTSKRTVEPLHIDAQVVFDEADLDAAFTDQADPDEVLFFAAFSDQWHALPVSEKLSVLSRIAKLAEDASLATSLNLAANPAEPKGKP